VADLRVVFIAALSHSGSTLLDMMLGSHPEFVGLGEMYAYLDPRFRHLEHSDRTRCSCGSVVDRCAFWGRVGEEIRAKALTSLRERHETLRHVFRDRFGPERTLVDSSKTLEALGAWTGRPGVETRVVYLVRDVRSWTVSMNDVSRRIGEYRLSDLIRKHGAKAPVRVLRRTPAGRFRQWYRGNTRIRNVLDRRGVPTFQLGYEELALHPARVLERLCDFLGTRSVDSMLSPEKSASHVVLGNRMHQQDDKRSAILYDDRWLHRNEGRLWAALSPRIMRYNASQVYANISDTLWNR
jgi:hypothetical protein